MVQKKSVQRLIAKGSIANALFRMADGGDDAAAVSGFSKELKIRFERLCWLSFLVGIKKAKAGIAAGLPCAAVGLQNEVENYIVRNIRPFNCL